MTRFRSCISITQYIAACSEDMTIKVKAKDNSTEEFAFIEHTGPVLRIDLSTTNLLASSSGDGSMKIWNLDEHKCVKTISGFDKIKSYQMTFTYGNQLLIYSLSTMSIFARNLTIFHIFIMNCFQSRHRSSQIMAIIWRIIIAPA